MTEGICDAGMVIDFDSIDCTLPEGHVGSHRCRAEDGYFLWLPIQPRAVFTCGLRISCTRCEYVVCADSAHAEYVADPHQAMREHKATNHTIRAGE